MTTRDKPARASVGLLAIAVAALLVALLVSSKEPAPPTAPSAQPAAAPASAPLAPAPTPALSQRKSSAAHAAPSEYRTWEPGMPHWYGNDPDPFVHQPHDYGDNVPRILGNRISYHIYDLETVQDMVRRGMDPASEIARATGAPLSEHQRDAGRAILQRFFDETVPNVDSMVAGAMSRDEGYALIGPRRQQLNRDLRDALDLTQDEFYAIWPHVREVDTHRAQLREPLAHETPPRLPEDD